MVSSIRRMDFWLLILSIPIIDGYKGSELSEMGILLIINGLMVSLICYDFFSDMRELKNIIKFFMIKIFFFFASLTL